MCIPFKWGLGFLTELLPLLKQFRCLGRFSWIFYYVFTVFTATYLYSLYRVLRRKGYRITGHGDPSDHPFVLGTGGRLKDTQQYPRIFNQNELLADKAINLEEILKAAGKSSEEFQGIFFLPFANTCGDKLQFERGLDAFSEAMSCSMQTGIPIIQSYSPRISLSQAMSSIQLLADSSIYKQRVNDMNQKPLLLLLGPEELNRQEQALLDRAETFWSGPRFSLAQLPVGSFNQGYESWRKLAAPLADSLRGTGMLCTGVDPGKVIYQDFEEFSSDQAFSGSGARYQKKGTMELFRENLFERFSATELELSFWLLVDHRTDNMPTPELWQWERYGSTDPQRETEFHGRCTMWMECGPGSALSWFRKKGRNTSSPSGVSISPWMTFF